MKNALTNQMGMLGDMFLWLIANLKQGVIYFIKQACGNYILASVQDQRLDMGQTTHCQLQTSQQCAIWVKRGKRQQQVKGYLKVRSYMHYGDTLAKTELLYPKNAGAQVAMDFK